MDDRLMSLIGGKIFRYVLRRDVVVVALAALLVFSPSARTLVGSAVVWFAERRVATQTEQLQERAEQLQRGFLSPGPVPVAPGKLRQLRRDMRHG